MHWLSHFTDFHLDVVGFLAILGEASVKNNIQVSTLSRFIYLPRLLPAPQALIRTSRPSVLGPASGKVVGVCSGNIRNTVNHIAHVLHDGDSLPPYCTKCVRLTKDPEGEARTKSWGPLTGLSLLGCGLSIALVVLSVVEADGMSLVATLLLSMLSSLVGYGAKWELQLSKRTETRQVPRGDVVIYYPQGSFLVVKCEEEVARELYWVPETCVYQVSEQPYRLLALMGTIMLMFGVIFLANSGLVMQLYFAGSYIILNVAYWGVAALPKQTHWDLSAYKVENMELVGGEKKQTFTVALWKAIAITGSSRWARLSHIPPQSREWNVWLERAEEMAMSWSDTEKGVKLVLPEWDATGALTELLKHGALEKW